MKYIYPISRRKFLYIGLDIVIILGAFIVSYLMRFYPSFFNNIELLSGGIFSVLVISYIISFYLLQIYRIMWAFSNINDIYRIVAANCIGFITFLSIIALLHIPYSRIIVILSFFIICGGTIFYRVLIRDYFHRVFHRINEKNSQPDLLNGKIEGEIERKDKRILIIGAGEAGRTLFSEYTRRGMAQNVIGFSDDSSFKIGKMLNGKMIYGPIDNLKSLIVEKEITEIVVAIPSASSEVINRIIQNIGQDFSNIPIKVLPSIIEMVDKRPLISALRKIGISDLIGREEVKVNSEVIKQEFLDKTVLVTGAGGSIGSEICRQILKFRAKRIVMVGRGEYAIYNLVKSITETCKFLDYYPEVVYRIADVKDKRLLGEIFQEYHPQIVFHAAAHKHVPLMEYNEIEALQNNVFGTHNVIDLSHQYKVSRLVIISTDKAVRPVNIMGATKRLAELAALYYRRKHNLNVSIVRFGNVVGSRGSVIPLFQEQIEHGGPVTVTHPDVVRYFMSIPEASLLVINACALSKGGEIFVLDMGKQYRILDIAKNLIELYGLRVGVDIDIVFTGLRPGEKLYEELHYKSENLLNTNNSKIFVLDGINNDVSMKSIENLLKTGIGHFLGMNSKDIRQSINEIIGEYDYSSSLNNNDESHRLVC
ncbi:MAG: polysaccharide biosynthesis protein [Prolixibacteraceae bacterium]|nr:polysaccharide biosynthesis protein [Prolixibacteraceae bacterium]